MDPNAHRFFDGFPCSEAMEASYKCLTENDFDHSKCEDYFSAYKECKKRWLQAKRKQKKLELFGIDRIVINNHHMAISVCHLF